MPDIGAGGIADKKIGAGHAGANLLQPGMGSNLVDDGDRTAVLRPGGFVMTVNGRALLAVADGLEATGIDTEGDQRVLGRGRTTLAEGEVVLARAALVGMAFDREGQRDVLLGEVSLATEDRLRIAADVRLVEREEHPVTDLLGQFLLRGERATRRRGLGDHASRIFIGGSSVATSQNGHGRNEAEKS